MNSQQVLDFRWMSPLGISVMLFLFINFIYLLMGVVTPIGFRMVSDRVSVMFGVVFSPRSDQAAFKKTPEQIIDEHPEVKVTRLAVYDMISGLYTAVAVLHFCIVWFGLRQGQSWALWALILSNLAIVAMFLLAARTFSAGVTPLRISDLAPYALVPGAILPFAVVLGWIGLR